MKQKLLAYLIPQLRDVLFISLLLGTWALSLRMLSLDSDLGRHMTLGRYILDSRIIPTRDLLSHTRIYDARPAYEWMTQIIFECANRLAGLAGVTLVTAFVIAATFTFVYSDARQRSSMPLLALGITVLAALSSSLHWLPRPHVMTFLMLAIWLAWLEGIRCGKILSVWRFPILMLMWVNLHGGFVFGVLAWLAYSAGWTWDRIHSASKEQIGKRLLWIGVFSLTTTLITPSGWGN